MDGGQSGAAVGVWFFLLAGLVLGLWAGSERRAAAAAEDGAADYVEDAEAF